MKLCFAPLMVALLTAVSGSVSSQPANRPNPSASAPYKLGDKLPGSAASAAAETFKLTSWDDLMPKDWDPMKGIKKLNFAMMRDGDPEVTKALNDMKRAWDRAPTEPSMDKARIRIAGFVVPLDGEGKALREFLLVPYFGACIHAPPPPANQTIHVTLATPVKGIYTMDAIWLSGQLRIAFSDTDLGTAGYRMDGLSVEPYKRP